MADNYLERRMEDYRSGSRNTPRRAPRLPKKSVLKILIVAEPDEALHSIIAPLAAAVIKGAGGKDALGAS